MPSYDVPTVTAPRSLSYQFLKLSDADFKMLAILGCIGFILIQLLGFLGFVIGVAILVWLMWPCSWSRRYYTFGEWVYGLWIRYMLKDVLWEDWLTAGLTDSPKRDRLRRKTPFPLRVDKVHQVGLIHNRRSDTDSILISGSGSDIAALSIRDQYDRQMQIAETIKKVAGYKGLTAEIGFVIRRRPYDIVEFDISSDHNVSPDILVPASAELVHTSGMNPEQLYKQGRIGKEELRRARLNEILVQSRAEVQTHGHNVAMITVITIKRDNRLRSAARKKGAKLLAPKETYSLKIVQLAEEACVFLEQASVRETQILDKQECEDYVRETWDVAGLDDYRKARIYGTDAGTDDEPLHYPQIRIRTGHNSCVFDQTHHAIIRISKLPKEIEPNLMPRLFSDPAVRWLSRSLVSETGTGDAEYRLLGTFTALYENILAGFGIVRYGPKTVKQQTALEDRRQEISDQEHAEYFNIYLAAANQDPEALEQDIDQLFRAVNGIGARAERVTGRSRQIAAAITANTGIALL